jgi:hypothetical protein
LVRSTFYGNGFEEYLSHAGAPDKLLFPPRIAGLKRGPDAAKVSGFD